MTFKFIPNFDNRYMINRDGVVIGPRGIPLKRRGLSTRYGKESYRSVSLYKRIEEAGKMTSIRVERSVNKLVEELFNGK